MLENNQRTLKLLLIPRIALAMHVQYIYICKSNVYNIRANDFPLPCLSI